MIDVGRPFSQPFGDLIASLEVSIKGGVEQPAVDRFVFQSSVTSYELRRTAHAITRVTGLVAGVTFTTFEVGVHFRFTNNRVIWLHATEKPLDGGQLTVEYTYRERPAGLTDFNEGSVTGTLMRAVARELKLLYDQVDEAYRRAFIDHAEGVALDNVVALLGIDRNPPLPAEGEVTFFRQNAAGQAYLIPVGTRVTDESERTFETTAEGLIAPDPLDEAVVHQAGTVSVRNRIATLEGVWDAVADPDVDPPLTTVDVTSDFPFGEDERTVQLDPVPAVRNLLVRYVAKSVTVPVAAQEPGPDGNVNANTIVIMPRPPTGIQGVVNVAPTSGGLAAEDDEPLRQRAKFHLERLGNATLNAIKFAVLEIDGVEAVEVADRSVDTAIPLGEVRVTYLGEAPQEDVEAVVEETRSAGILVQLAKIQERLVSGTWHVVPEPTVPVSAVDDFAQAIIDAIAALEIGEPVSLRRLNALVYNVGGLADVVEAVLVDESAATLPDPFLIGRSEIIRADEAAIDVILLTAIGVDGAPRLIGSVHELDMQLLTEAGVATLQSLTLDLSIVLRVSLQAAPDQPPSILGTLTGRVTFAGEPSAVLRIDGADIAVLGFDHTTHTAEVPVTISARAYPGLLPAEATLTVTQ